MIGSAPGPRTRRFSPPLEPLESRRLMSTGASPLGGEFKVGGPVEWNAYTQQSVDLDAAGNFVVAWTGYDVPGDPNSRVGIQARRYRADGTPVGEPFVVNSGTFDDQLKPSVAVDADGDFVVTWLSNVEGNGQTNVYARLFDKNGNPRGEDFLVNEFVTDSQMNPAVASDAAGNFVIAWTDFENGSFEGTPIKIRRYNSSGTALSGETVVGHAAFTDAASIAMEPDGDFIMAWSQTIRPPGQLGSDEIMARRFDAAGSPRGEAFRVNAITAGAQMDAEVSVNSSGAFAVSWVEGPGRGGGGIQDRVFARSFDAAGNPLRPEIPVSSIQEMFPTVQDEHAVAIDEAGRYLVTWSTSNAQFDNDSGVVMARAFDATGAPHEDMFRVNTTTAGGQFNPAVAMTGAGDAVVVWSTVNVPEAQSGVFGQRLRLVDEARPAASVVDRHLFYNRSVYDGGAAGGPPVVDDEAIAPDKEALLPGQTATFASVSNYSRGINGIMIDVADLPGAADFLTPDSFGLHIGPGRGAEARWGEAPRPSELFIRRNVGAGGSDRVVLVWPDGAVKNTYLRVTLPANEMTGLAQPDVFYFGNLVGETGDLALGPGWAVTAMDVYRMTRARRTHRGQVPITDVYDIDRDRAVGLSDERAQRMNLYRAIPAFTAPPDAPPPAADVEHDDDGSPQSLLA